MKLLFTLFFAFALFNVNAQNVFPLSGNAGIGITSSLIDPLTLKPSTDGKGLMILPSGSNPNTGNYLQLTSHPYYNFINQIKSNSARLDIISNNQLFLFANDIFFQGNTIVTRNNDVNPNSVATSISSGTMPFQVNLYSSSLGAGVIKYSGLQNIASTTQEGLHRIAFKMAALQSNLEDGNEVMSIFSDSTVGIGTTNTKGYRLAVNGAAVFNKVVVQTYPWADYVFEKSYKLPSLSDIEKFILEHKHLPEMPTAAEVEKNGIDIAGTQVLLLKKVEELTLHAIDQNKRLEAQQKEIQNQRDEIKKLNEKLHTKR